MPLLKHAKKKQRQDKKRTIHNKKIKETYKSLVKSAKEEKTAETLKKAFSGLDKAAKEHIIHKNKAARMKSVLSRLVGSSTSSSSASKKSTRTTTKKKSSSKK